MRLSLYIARRLVLLIPTLIGVSIITFALSHAAGPLYSASMYCNPHARISCPQQLAPIIAHYHLNDPIPVQYVYYLQALFQGDWGFTSTDLFIGSVSDAIVLFFPPTIELAVGAIIVATLVGIPTGTISAVKKDKLPDHITRIVALAGYSVPYFVLAIFMQIIAAQFKWPISGTYDLAVLNPTQNPWAFAFYEGGPQLFSQPTHMLVLDAALHGDWGIFWDALAHLALPVFTLAFGVLGVVLRMIRSGMVDVMNQDYVRTAWSKGLPKRVVIGKHVRRNALLPAATVIGLLFAYLLGGVVLVEDIFAWSGLGRWATAAILQSDAGGVMGSTIIFALALVFTNLGVDIVYARLDPRITL